MTRRNAIQQLVVGTMATLLIEDGTATAAADKTNALKLWYDRPAKEWTEALPIGNGRLGAMVFGGVYQERLQLNEESLWAGGPHDYNSLEAKEALPEIRRLVFAEEWKKAQDLVNAKFMGRPGGQSPYQTVGDLYLDFAQQEAEFSDYRRTLDLDTATTVTTYTQNGIRYTREAFASYPDNVIVLRLTSDKKGEIWFTLGFKSPQSSQAAVVGTDTVSLSGVSGGSNGTPGQVRFQALARVLTTGAKATITSGADGTLLVAEADSVTILLSMATSYRSYKDVSGNAEELAQKYLDAAAKKSYKDLLKAHIADYQPLFRRVSLNLGTGGDGAKRPTNERVTDFAKTNDAALVALHFQYGRYLLLSCSRPGNLEPANLQGVWNDHMNPPWGSKYTVNINTEMNYWPAGPANLLECYDPLFRMVEDIAQTGKESAQMLYGADGWVTHHNVDAWRGTAPVDGAFWGTWPTGGAWLCKSFRDYYDFTGDKALLERAYPVLKGAATFFLDAMVTDPKSGFLVTCPSISPENGHHRDASICAGPTMDNQIVHDLFDSVLLASEKLQRDPEFREKVKSAQAKLPPMKVGAQGQLQEWQEDWDSSAPEQNHRHVSHLYGLYPSNQISPEKTPELFAGARKSLEHRGDMATGWSLAWKINLWARLRDGDHAYELIRGLLTPERTAPNLFDLHPPFQIDGNFGATSGVCEMLLQSQDGVLHLLPALPSVWKEGKVTGLRARGGFTVGITWKEGRLIEATIYSPNKVSCILRYGENTAKLSLKERQTITWNGSPVV